MIGSVTSAYKNTEICQVFVSSSFEDPSVWLGRGFVSTHRYIHYSVDYEPASTQDRM